MMKSHKILDEEFLDPSFFDEQFERIKSDVREFQRTKTEDIKGFEFDMFNTAKYAKHIAFKNKNISEQDLQNSSDCWWFSTDQQYQKTYALTDSQISAIKVLFYCYSLINFSEGYTSFEYSEIQLDDINNLQNAFGILLRDINTERAWDAGKAEQELVDNMPNIKRGDKILSGAKSGHEAVHGTDEEKSRRWRQYEHDCIELKKRNNKLGVTEIRRIVAQKHGVAYDTVRRNTQNLKNSEYFQ